MLAEACEAAGIPFVTFSTDYVFDGESVSPYRETDPTAPINAYGRSKLQGERAALRHSGSLVIRTSWLQSPTHPCFLRTIIRLAVNRDEIEVVRDQLGRPTFADDLARASLEAVDLGVTGLLHVANTGETSWYALAARAISLSRFSAFISPVSSKDFPTEATRPKYSVLDTSRLESLGIAPLPHWERSLEAVVPLIDRAQ